MDLYDLDERQKRIRWQTAFHTCLLLMLLVFLDGLVTQQHPWAEPAIGAILLVFLSTMYFVGATIWRGAYQVDNPTVNRTMILYPLVGGLNLAALTANWASGDWEPVKNGLLSVDLLPLVLGIFFLYVYIMWWSKRRYDRWQEKQEEE